MTTPVIFICGATGAQGGAVVQQARQLGWEVHATARNLSSPQSKALAELGVRLTQGDWDNEAALAASIAGCTKLFLVLFPNFADMSAEARQARSILRIAKAAGVTQVVASTSLGVSQLDLFKPGCFMEKHLQSKKAIEQAVLEEGFESCTFLRPAFLMANFLEPKTSRFPEVRDKGTFTNAGMPSTQLPLLDHVDIGRVALAAFQDPAGYNRRAIGMASQLLTAEQALDTLAKAAGRQPGDFKPVYMTDEQIEAAGDPKIVVYSPESLRSLAEYVDMEELGSIAPLNTFGSFLERERAGVAQTYQKQVVQ